MCALAQTLEFSDGEGIRMTLGHCCETSKGLHLSFNSKRTFGVRAF